MNKSWAEMSGVERGLYLLDHRDYKQSHGCLVKDCVECVHGEPTKITKRTEHPYDTVDWLDEAGRRIDSFIIC